MIVKRIYDKDKNIAYKAKRNQILGLLFEFSLTNQLLCSSKSITQVVARSVNVEMIASDNLKALITQVCQCIYHLASGSNSVTLRSIDSLCIRKPERKKKKISEI